MSMAAPTIAGFFLLANLAILGLNLKLYTEIVSERRRESDHVG